MPITGVFQLGWPTILTTLFIRLHVSQSTHTHAQGLLFVFSAMHRCQHLSVSTAYGDVQVHCALIMFAVCIYTDTGRNIVYEGITISCEMLYFHLSDV